MQTEKRCSNGIRIALSVQRDEKGKHTILQINDPVQKSQIIVIIFFQLLNCFIIPDSMKGHIDDYAG